MMTAIIVLQLLYHFGFFLRCMRHVFCHHRSWSNWKSAIELFLCDVSASAHCARNRSNRTLARAHTYTHKTRSMRVSDWFCSIQAHNEFAVNESISYMPTVQKISISQTTNCQLVHHIASIFFFIIIIVVVIFVALYVNHCWSLSFRFFFHASHLISLFLHRILLISVHCSMLNLLWIQATKHKK